VSAVYPEALAAFMRGELDLLTLDVYVHLATTAYVYDPAHVTLDDAAPAGVGVSSAGGVLLAAKTVGVAGVGAFDADNVDAPSTVIVVYADDTTDLRLLAWLDGRSDTTPLRFDADGGDVPLRWHPAGIFTI
jgi:hypothetical protein